MTLEQFKQIIEQTGIPVRYKVFKEKQPMPYAVYWLEYTENLKADNVVYYQVQHVAVDLFTEKKDPVTESKFEKVFHDNDIPWDKSEEYVDELDLFMITYSVYI